MQIELLSGNSWVVAEPTKKLAFRAQLPGARLFDLAGESLRAAKRLGTSASDRFTLALPASWLVNSPAISRVLRRWALEPHRETCLALVELLEGGPAAWEDDPGTADAIRQAVASLGDEPYIAEALSKTLALLVPEAVPLMPDAARAFVLGTADRNEPDAFGRMVDWFARAAIEHHEALARVARDHREVELTPGGVLDRLLWFDSEGHVHFPHVGPLVV
jgi:hypothetical protein